MDGVVFAEKKWFVIVHWDGQTESGTGIVSNSVEDSVFEVKVSEVAPTFRDLYNPPSHYLIPSWNPFVGWGADLINPKTSADDHFVFKFLEKDADFHFEVGDITSVWATTG